MQECDGTACVGDLLTIRYSQVETRRTRAYGLLDKINRGIQVRLRGPLEFGIFGSQMSIDLICERKDE
jgi:hypothetical protein